MGGQATGQRQTWGRLMPPVCAFTACATPIVVAHLLALPFACACQLGALRLALHPAYDAPFWGTRTLTTCAWAPSLWRTWHAPPPSTRSRKPSVLREAVCMATSSFLGVRGKHQLQAPLHVNHQLGSTRIFWKRRARAHVRARVGRSSCAAALPCAVPRSLRPAWGHAGAVLTLCPTAAENTSEPAPCA